MDGVCCNLPCTSDCRACLSVETGMANGTCGNVAAGSDPAADCTGQGTCDGHGVCSCIDGIKNFDETDIDCGGSCIKCQDGQDCNESNDCTSGLCTAGKCAP